MASSFISSQLVSVQWAAAWDSKALESSTKKLQQEKHIAKQAVRCEASKLCPLSSHDNTFGESFRKLAVVGQALTSGNQADAEGENDIATPCQPRQRSAQLEVATHEGWTLTAQNAKFCAVICSGKGRDLGLSGNALPNPDFMTSHVYERCINCCEGTFYLAPGRACSSYVTQVMVPKQSNVSDRCCTATPQP